MGVPDEHNVIAAAGVGTESYDWRPPRKRRWTRVEVGRVRSGGTAGYPAPFRHSPCHSTKCRGVFEELVAEDTAGAVVAAGGEQLAMEKQFGSVTHVIDHLGRDHQHQRQTRA